MVLRGCTVNGGFVTDIEVMKDVAFGASSIASIGQDSFSIRTFNFMFCSVRLHIQSNKATSLTVRYVFCTSLEQVN